MTSKDLSIFNSLRPFSIGFDDMFDTLIARTNSIDTIRFLAEQVL